jgi:hypothetical protein
MMDVLDKFFVLLAELVLSLVKLFLHLLLVCEPLLVKILLLCKEYIELLLQHFVRLYPSIYLE